MIYDSLHKFTESGARLWPKEQTKIVLLEFTLIGIRHELGVFILFHRYSELTCYWTHGGQLPKKTYGRGGISFDVENDMLCGDRV